MGPILLLGFRSWWAQIQEKRSTSFSLSHHCCYDRAAKLPRQRFFISQSRRIVAFRILKSLERILEFFPKRSSSSRVSISARGGSKTWKAASSSIVQSRFKASDIKWWDSLHTFSVVMGIKAGSWIAGAAKRLAKFILLENLAPIVVSGFTSSFSSSSFSASSSKVILYQLFFFSDWIPNEKLPKGINGWESPRAGSWL